MEFHCDREYVGILHFMLNREALLQYLLQMSGSPFEANYTVVVF